MKLKILLFVLTISSTFFLNEIYAQEKCDLYSPEYAYNVEDSPDFGKEFTVYFFVYNDFSRFYPIDSVFISDIYSLTFINYSNTDNIVYNFRSQILRGGFAKKVSPLLAEGSQVCCTNNQEFACLNLEYIKKMRLEAISMAKKNNNVLLELHQLDFDSFYEIRKGERIYLELELVE